jgi:glutathione-regulated potassium-efflux system ancillary protein KefF
VYDAAVDPTTALIFAHPYPDRSRANRSLLEAVRDLPFVNVRNLYASYPDFSIDVENEQRALAGAKLIVWQHPMYWYSAPALLKLWFEKVLSRGWAYGEGGSALRGKSCLWIVTAGGDDAAFSSEGMHGHAFQAFVPVVEQTARFCGMKWLEPIVVPGAHRIADDALGALGRTYRGRLEALHQELCHG